MQVILRQTMDNLGEAGSIVNVKDGYARNFLFPRELAAPATTGMKRQLEHLKRLAEKRRLRELRTAEDLRDRLEISKVEIQARVGEKDKLYGSVTTVQIAEALAAQGITIDRRKIVLDHPIRELGEHTVRIKVDPKVTASLKVIVGGSAESGSESLFASERPATKQEADFSLD
jgi:large subunit ribosomal protein L9